MRKKWIPNMILVNWDPSALNAGAGPIAVGQFTRVAASRRTSCLEAPAKTVLAGVQLGLTPEKIKEDKHLKAYQAFYKRTGVDPDIFEYDANHLITRALEGSRFLEKNTVYSALNLVSVSNRISMAGFDLSRIDISFGLTVRPAEAGEVITRSEPNKLKGGEIVLVDGANTILSIYPNFVNVTAEIRETTREMLIIAFGVEGIANDFLMDSIVTSRDFFKYCRSAEMTNRWMAQGK